MTKEEMMARIEGIDPRQTSFLMRQVFKKVRKMLGRDLTPQKIAARVPRVFWVNALAEWLIGQKAAVPQRLRMLIVVGTAVRGGGPNWPQPRHRKIFARAITACSTWVATGCIGRGCDSSSGPLLKVRFQF